MRCCDLTLVERPLDWVRDPWRLSLGEPELPDTIKPMPPVRRIERAASLYLFNLLEARTMLDGVEFTCKGFSFFERVRALFPPSQRDRILGVM